MTNLKTYYLDKDLHSLVNLTNSFHFLYNPKSLLTHLTELNELLIENEAYLNEYPYTRYEFLESLYAFNLQISTFSPQVFIDFLNLNNQKIVMIAVYFSLFSPNQIYIPFLKNVLANQISHPFLISLAINNINYEITSEQEPYFKLIQNIRKQLSFFHKISLPLRLNLTDLQLSQIGNESDSFKAFYSNHTLEESLSQLQKLPLLQYFNMSHQEWIKKGAVEAPILFS